MARRPNHAPLAAPAPGLLDACGVDWKYVKMVSKGRSSTTETFFISEHSAYLCGI
jgi:hypothetical protein